MPKSKLIETAKQIEDLLTQALELAEGKDLIAPSFMVAIRVTQRNVVKNAYSQEESK